MRNIHYCFGHNADQGPKPFPVLKTETRKDLRTASGSERHAGFTLLEILIALSVLAIALTAIWKLHAQTLSMHETIRFHTLAPFLAQQKLAELEMQPELNQISHQGDFGPDYPAYLWKLTVDPVQSGEWKKLNSDFHRLELIITDPRADLDYPVRTYRLKQP
ncbi:MAG: prepilin-type N-terminal cleavage/methylation domain-containing protein [Desulfatirhabdiaceae bacterium]